MSWGLFGRVRKQLLDLGLEHLSHVLDVELILLGLLGLLPVHLHHLIELLLGLGELLLELRVMVLAR